MVSLPPEASLTRFANAATAIPYGWVGVVTSPSRSTFPLDELEPLLFELPHAPSASASAATPAIATSFPSCPFKGSPFAFDRRSSRGHLPDGRGGSASPKAPATY